MNVLPLKSWTNRPAFAAAGVRMLPPDKGGLERHARLVVIDGAAVHQASGVRVGAGMVAEFEAGEPLDLLVEEDLTYWMYEVE